MREWLGFWLAEKAFKVLPVSSGTRLGMMRGLREQRDYDRYTAYCALEKTDPFSFDKWREVRSFLRVKMASVH